ncbi:MAG TPA: glycosyltransferase family A protein [Solirubrobacteraceae bacterium]|nr:glycosyltransferase family A protein [Solirubrobacteraceae bacterium]
MAQVSVIIPARDAERTLADALAGVGRAAEGIVAELIVVDNGSRDGTAELAERLGAAVVRRERGEGPGAARNAGMHAASADRVAFVDADCRPRPRWLRAGLAALEHADLVQGAVCAQPGAGPFDRTVSVPAASGLFEAASLFVRREIALRVGGFPGGLEPPGQAPFGEDALFGWAVARAGGRVGWCPEAIVEHVVIARDARAFVAERTRLALFPELVARIPELRDGRLFARWFLSRRSAAFDAALCGALLATGTRRRSPLLAAAPYAALVAREARAWGPRIGPRVAAAGLLADAVGASALARGSVRSGTAVL